MEATTAKQTPDYGHNGKGADGLYTMHPSGDRVTKAECDKRLAANRNSRLCRPVSNEIFGMSWDELERRQGGKIQRT